ncbi:hypothetical protein P0Y35_18455 [Kiritimatiellaeota bacterium B1221]|nr:hypothetical protein [Kiritimatiellaeota bacterium B1221]
MWLITLLLFLGVIITGFLSKSDSKWTPLVIGLTLLLITSMSLQFLKLGGDKGNQVNYSTLWEEAIGYQLAQALSNDGIQSGTVLILDENIEGAENPLADIHLKGFRQGLHTEHLNLVGINANEISTTIELGLDVPEEMASVGPIDLSTTLLMKAIRNQPDVVALVSFVGLPASMPAELLSELPPLYLFGLNLHTADFSDEDLLRTSSVRAIVRRKPGAGTQLKPSSKNLDEVFSERFVLNR